MKNSEKAQVSIKMKMPNGLLLEYEGVIPKATADQINSLLINAHLEVPSPGSEFRQSL